MGRGGAGSGRDPGRRWPALSTICHTTGTGTGATYSFGVSQPKIDVEIMHPPALVWRALTEAKLLNEWFQPIAGWPESGARPGSQGRVFPTDDLWGFGSFDIDLVEAEPHSRLVFRWRGDDFTIEITCEIHAIPGGSRITACQDGFLGKQEAERRESLRSAHQVMIERLRAAVDRLALGFGEAAFLEAETPVPSPRGHHRARVLSLAGAAIVAMLFATAGAVWLGRDTPPPPAPAPVGEGNDSGLGAGTPPGLSTSPSKSPAVVGTPSAKPSTQNTSAASVVPSGKPLIASYQTNALLGLGGFDTEVTVENTGGAAHTGWTVVLTMPDSTAVENRSPETVKMQQTGEIVTLTPVSAVLPAGEAVTFTIRFPALLALGQSIKACTVDGQPCTAA